MPTAYDRLPCITIIHHRSDRLLYGPILPYQIPDYLTTLPPIQLLTESSNVCSTVCYSCRLLYLLLGDCPDNV